MTQAYGPTSYPVHLRGDRDEKLSRWLWLFKWLLALPHYVVLVFLGVAFGIVSIIAFFAILFTGRYPRKLFDFNVGVMRWSWRVGFYSYSALGTDRYPPFTLRRTDYPADFDVEYPERLSRGLVLVKWWLLAIPHNLLILTMTRGAIDVATGQGGSDALISIPLTGALILAAAIALLFTGRYPAGLFDFLVGIHRWIYRVGAYVALMRDEYPPFRLDQGAHEPSQGRHYADAND